VGVWEDGAFVGVVLFARGASPQLGTQFGLAQTECCELVRIALRAHRTPVTRIVRFALQLLRKRSPGIKLVVSFADANQGHHGGIYQGGGWIYTGTSPRSKAYVDATGRQWHNRQITASGFVTEFGHRRRCKKTSEVRAVQLLGKHRYLMPLDDAVRARVEKLARPYPKRSAEPLLRAPASSAILPSALQVLQARWATSPQETGSPDRSAPLTRAERLCEPVRAVRAVRAEIELHRAKLRARRANSRELKRAELEAQRA
jgi:hypothetical protein